jgi:hypothetical protein
MRASAIMLSGLVSMVLQGSAQTDPVSNPYEAEYFSCEGKPDGRLFNNAFEKFGYGRFRIAADLNFDGREDLILSKSDRNEGTGCGNAECDVRIFLQQSDRGYRRMDFGLHPLAAALKMIKPGEGQLVTYHRSSAFEGVLAFHRVTSDSVAGSNTQTLHYNDSARDKALYESWFSESLALRVEYARCMKGQLEWSDSLR